MEPFTKDEFEYLNLKPQFATQIYNNDENEPATLNLKSQIVTLKGFNFP
jgi:hypothetical protein